jgi:hypothetical protein
MFTASDFLRGLVLPGCVTGLVLLAGWYVTRRRWSARDSRSWVGPVAVATGFVAGYLALFGWPGFPPLDAVDWLVFLAPLLAAAALVDALGRVDWPPRVLLILLGASAALVLVGWPLLWVDGAADGPAWRRLVVGVLIASAYLIPFDVLSVRVRATHYCALALGVAVPATAALVLSASARLGLAAAVLTATQAAALVAYLILGRTAFARGTVPVFGTLLAGLLWAGNSYAELQTIDALLLGLAPNAAWTQFLVHKDRGWMLRTACPLLLAIAIACVPAARLWLATEPNGYSRVMDTPKRSLVERPAAT